MTLKRYAMPAFWPVPRKQKLYVSTPNPGPHGKKECLPLQVILRDILKLASNGKEVKTILSAKNIVVDKRIRTDSRYPVGLQDVLEMPAAKKQYRVVAARKGLMLQEIKPGESDRKLCRITGKIAIKKGKIRLACHDGRNIIVEKAKDYKVGDSLLISLPEQGIIRHFPLKEGEYAVITAGRNMGVEGTIKKIRKRAKMQEESTVSIQAEGREIQTLLDYVMVGRITNDSVPKKQPSRKERAKTRAAKKEGSK